MYSPKAKLVGLDAHEECNEDSHVVRMCPVNPRGSEGTLTRMKNTRDGIEDIRSITERRSVIRFTELVQDGFAELLSLVAFVNVLHQRDRDFVHRWVTVTDPCLSLCSVKEGCQCL